MDKDKAIIKFREHNNELLPKWYKWELHLLFNVTTFIVFLALGFVRIDFSSSFVMLKLIISFLIWGIVEYTIHRFVLHGKYLNSLPFYKDHSVYHHGYFTDKNMLKGSMHDINRVLLRPMDVFAVLCLNLFLCALLSIVIGIENSTYFYFSGVVYLIVYEVFHYRSHSYKGNNNFWIGIKNHHTDHHIKAEMKEVNFAVVFPFMDKIFNTEKNNKNALRKL